MSAGKALRITTGEKHLDLAAYDVSIRLDLDEVRQLAAWMKRSLSMTVTELFKVAYPGAEMEARNYPDHFDFIMFVHRDGELSARVLFLGKDEAPAVITCLERALESTAH